MVKLIGCVYRKAHPRMNSVPFAGCRVVWRYRYRGVRPSGRGLHSLRSNVLCGPKRFCAPLCVQRIRVSSEKSIRPSFAWCGRIIASLKAKFTILHPLGMFVADLFKSRYRLEAENLLLHRQFNIALRRAPPRLRLGGGDRALLVWMTWLWPSLLGVTQVIQSATIKLTLKKDARFRRAVQRSGAIGAVPILAGLHHQYVWI